MVRQNRARRDCPRRLHFSLRPQEKAHAIYPSLQRPAKIRLRNAAANFALLRRFALNLFRLDKSRGKSMPTKRKAAAWNSQYVVDLLKLQPLQEI